MSTVVAQHTPSPLSSRDQDSHPQPARRSPRTYTPIAPAKTAALNKSAASSASKRAAKSRTTTRSPSEGARAAAQTLQMASVATASQPATQFGKLSPSTIHATHDKSSSNAPTPSVPTIKKERHSSPDPTSHATPSTTSSSRHRPRRLDLSTDKSTSEKPPLTSKDSSGLSVMQDVGIACLSPGFVTQDPTMQEQVQRSIELREQQRKIIESRLHKSSMKSHVESAQKEAEASPITARPPGSSRRKGPPPGLSITAPSAHQFASEPRVIQSAPLNHSFTGLRPSATTHAHPLSRQILDHSHNASQYTHEQPQRLPPIHDVFNSRTDSNLYAPIGPLPSPGFPQRPVGNATLPQPGASQLPSFPPSSGAPPAPPSRGGEREFRSADEALRSLSGGREPKLVHYGGHQPPTPPSPLPHPETTAYRGDGPAAAAGRRRNREEYEEGEDQDDEEDRTSAKYGRAKRRERERRGSADREREGRDQRKKDEFMALCARAWDLLHS